MFYIAFICMCVGAALSGNSGFLSDDVKWLFNASMIMLPIWWGIRSCLREIEKIRRLAERQQKGKECEQWLSK